MLRTLVNGPVLIAFAIGVVLTLIIMRQTSNSKDKESLENVDTNNNVALENVRTVENTKVSQSQNQISDDAEIAAAIIAAICAYTNMSSNEFTIKGIRRISDNDSAWRKAGII
jgi:hypothetical protein